MAQLTLRRANPNTIQDKLLVGYQGWFTCAGDGEPIGPGHHGWLHWFNSPIPSGGRPNTDIWPDTSDYDPSELYPAPGLTTASGDPVYLFSSRHPNTVRRHFHWMALHGVDGAFLQRFAGQCEIKPGNHGIRDLRDEIGDRVREAAEAEGRVFAIMYDVSGVSSDKIQNILQQDWAHLLADQRLLDSPNYVRENGRPVVALWGFGFNGREHTPDLVREITEFFRSNTPGGVYLVAGAPGHWRTLTSDADRNPGFAQVWTECFDAISPWTVGRYGNEEEADRWGEERVKADAEYLKKLEEQGGRKIDYIPVVLPGGSGFNLSGGKWGMNDIRRNGGRFLWRQIYNARRAGVRTIYGAMWDEYDEGTAFMPVVSYSSQLPVHPSYRFIALDIDGHDLPSDWYMRIAGFAAEALHGERTLLDTFPFKELQDYWSTRPRHEGKDDEQGKKQVDVDGVTRAFREWQVSGGHADVPIDAPPPYSLQEASAQQRLQQQLSSGTGRTGRPPVPQDSRPSPSHSSLSIAARAAAVPLAAAAVAHTLSAGSASAPRHTPPSLPPRVDMSTRPSPPTRSHHPSAPPLPERTHSTHGHLPEPGVGVHRPMYHPHHSGHVPSFGHIPRPNPGMAFPAMTPVEYARGRSRSRSKPRSHSRSRSGSRRRKHKHSRSRSKHRRSSSSGSRKKGRSPIHVAHHPQAHAQHAHSLSHSHTPHGHGHSLSPVGSSHGMAFPGQGGGLYHAHSEGGGHGHGHGHGHGSYTPVHSAPVGHAHLGHAASVGSAYAPYAQQGQGHQAYAPVGHYSNQQPHPHQGGYDVGYGYGQGQGQGHGYDGMGGSQPYPPHPAYGYTPQPPSSPYYTSYVPSSATPNAGPAFVGGSGGGGIQGGIASALQVVEEIAGKQFWKRGSRR